MFLTVIQLRTIQSANNGGNLPGNVPGSYWGNTIPGPLHHQVLMVV
jgi:hypothetical protein